MLLINRGWYMDKEWIPAFAAEHHLHCTNMLVGSTPQKRPSH